MARSMAIILSKVAALGRALIPARVSKYFSEAGRELQLPINSQVDQTAQLPITLNPTAADLRLLSGSEPSGEVFWMLDPAAGRIVYVSPGFESIWGRSCEHLYRNPAGWIDSVHPADRERAQTGYLKQLRGGTVANEYRIVRPDGGVRHIRDRGFPVFDDLGNVIRIAGVAEDVTSYRESAAALARSEFRFQRLVESDLIGVFNGTADGRILEANEEFLRLIGYTRADLQNGLVRWDKMTPPEYQQVNRRVDRGLKNTGRAAPVEIEFLRKDGSRVPVLMGLASIEADSSKAIGFVLDISRRKAAEEELRRSDEKFRQFAGNIREVLWLVNVETSDLIYVSPAYEKIWLRSCESAYRGARAWLEAIHPDDREQAEAVWERQRLGEVVDNEYRIVQPSGEVRWIRDRAFPVRDAGGRIIRIGGVAEDITERKRYEVSLRYQATHDQLTDLPNRRLLLEELQKAIAGQRENGGILAVFYIDLDRFKLVNDSLGHAAGDQLLRKVTGRLRAATRESDTLARVGGDEFVLVASGFLTSEEVRDFGCRLLDSLHPPFSVAGRELFIGACIGVSLFPDDGDDPDVLQRMADTAGQEAKRGGKGQLLFFSRKFAEEARERLAAETRLRRALAEKEFCLQYQPEFAHGGATLVRFEALIRWQPPDSEPISPESFIPVAEENGLIVPIGTWVLTEACRAAAAWQRGERRGIGVAVNVSAQQFAQPDFLSLVKRALEASGLAPALLDLEITETVFIADFEDSARKLAQLKELGIRVALDDFGTGYSSLSYLRNLPIDVIKIDRSFLTETGQNQCGEAVLRCLIELAHALGIRVIAEGVETTAQLALLQRLGCDELQGFLLGRPGF